MKVLIVMILALALLGCKSTPSLPTSCYEIETCSNLVRMKLQSNFIVEESWKGSSITIEFFLDDDANVIESKVFSTTGLVELEKAGMKSIYDSSPFTELLKLPNDTYKEFKHIKLTIVPFG
jgi:hypothetical protein